MIGKLKNVFQFFVGMATIISCFVAIIGVIQVVNLVVEVRPVVNELQRLVDTVVVCQNVFRRDTVVVKESVVRFDTVIVYRDVFKRDTVFLDRVKPGRPETKVPGKEKDIINQHEADYRKKIDNKDFEQDK